MDKPYVEPTGGSYLHDLETGKVTQTAKAPERPDPNFAPPAVTQPVADELPVESGKKKDK